MGKAYLKHLAPPLIEVVIAVKLILNKKIHLAGKK